MNLTSLVEVSYRIINFQENSGNSHRFLPFDLLFLLAMEKVQCVWGWLLGGKRMERKDTKTHR